MVHCIAWRNHNSFNVGKFLCDADIFILLLVRSIAKALSSNARVVQRVSCIASKKISFSSSPGLVTKFEVADFETESQIVTPFHEAANMPPKLG